MWPESHALMLRQSIIAATIFVALGATPELCAQATPQQPSAQVQKQGSAIHPGAKSGMSGKQTKQQPTTVIVAPPPPPPTPEQMPSVAPEVIYQGGMLTIKAPNSTMNDVLSAVRRVTGATIEKPPVGGTDRVVAQLGPGQPKDVLGALFKGSRYDYIILGSMTRPGGVDRVILTARANAAGAPAAATAANNALGGRAPKPNVQPVENADQDEPETDTEDMTVPERDQAEPEQPEPQQQQPQQQQPQQPPGMPVAPPQDQSQQQGQNPDQNQQPRVKSPDELLRELQQMQKQPPDQNQQQQEQNPPQ